MNLTQTQKNILIRMDRGEALYVNTIDYAVYLSGSPSAVRPKTFDVLIELAVIAKSLTQSHVRISEYRITDKGREAIK